MLTVNDIRDIVAKIGAKYGIKNAYLFGSYATGHADENSDVDLIIEKGALRTYDAYADMKLELSNALGTNVDLLTTEGVRPRFFELIKNDRILLYGA